VNRTYKIRLYTGPTRNLTSVQWRHYGAWREVKNESMRRALVTIGANHSMEHFAVTLQDVQCITCAEFDETEAGPACVDCDGMSNWRK
jgi:hypothetical protein